MIWFACPTHNLLLDNTRRIKFNDSMFLVMEKFPGMRMLSPKTGWNINDSDLISTSGNNYTGLGVVHLWKAIDDAIHFWDVHNGNPLRLLGYDAKFIKKLTTDNGQKKHKPKFNPNFKWRKNYFHK